jgi:aldose 1-epimerase
MLLFYHSLRKMSIKRKNISKILKIRFTFLSFSFIIKINILEGDLYMDKKLFGTTSVGESIYAYTIKNDIASVTVLNFGGILQSFTVHGISIVGGYDFVEDYEADTSHQGGLIGRVANRVANAAFEMDGKTYMLPVNNGKSCLHGGIRGFDRRIWQIIEANENEIKLFYHAEDGEEGFPGALDVTVIYRLEGGDLLIDYTAIPHSKTPIALTNHAYFNLNGFGDTIHTHLLTLAAERYTEMNESILPTGNRPEVFGTPFDFTVPRAVGAHFSDTFSGYDHNFILSPKTSETVCGMQLPLVATLEGDSLIMKTYTDQKGVQIYTANFLKGDPKFSGNIQRIKHGAICLETQTEPGAIARGEIFYDKGQVYRHQTVYSVKKKA